ncbi:hypothetical protein [uncultured Roseibium sp.]|uniref:hypothetical protein n=1 Tax=uncultured Roseibium sp. TaxID=1936171 RepID=UPI00260736C8|nr:hypothetical protein [uncultured Roseibium sp.]
MTDASDFPKVTEAFMASYDHATPSGHGHPACKRNRLANIGIDCRQSAGSPIDLDLMTDREYTYICETSDDGWLIGGGDTTKLKRPDTAHAEIWRFGPDNADEGGISFETVEAILGAIRFAPIKLKPKKINLTPSSELELLCVYEPDSVIGTLFGVLSDVLACPCGDYGNPFHITLVRGVKFRSAEAQAQYLATKQRIVETWRAEYPDGVMFNDGGIDLFRNREEILSHFPPTLNTGFSADLDALKAMR